MSETVSKIPQTYVCEGVGCTALNDVLNDARNGASELLLGHNIPARMQVVPEIQDYVQRRFSQKCKFTDGCLAAQGDATAESRERIGTGLGGDL